MARKPSSKSKGLTAVKHARALVAEKWPGAPVLEAQKAVTWIPAPTKADPDARRPISRREDLFGVFDLLVLSSPVVLIQVTTEHEASGGGAAATRRHKVRMGFIEPHQEAARTSQLLVWSWVARTHMLVWEWDHLQHGWVRRPPLRETGSKAKTPEPVDEYAPPF